MNQTTNEVCGAPVTAIVFFRFESPSPSPHGRHQVLNASRYDHFHGIKLSAQGSIVPAPRNPFETGSP